MQVNHINHIAGELSHRGVTGEYSVVWKHAISNDNYFKFYQIQGVAQLASPHLIKKSFFFFFYKIEFYSSLI